MQTEAAERPVPSFAEMGQVVDDACARIEELRERCNALHAANEGWKRAFNDLHDAMEKIAGGDLLCASTLQDMARAALHAEDA